MSTVVERPLARTVELTQQALDTVAEMWRPRTGTEDARALIARGIIDSVLEARCQVTEYDALDAEIRKGRR